MCSSIDSEIDARAGAVGLREATRQGASHAGAASGSSSRLTSTGLKTQGWLYVTLDRDLAPKEYTGDPGIWLVLRQGAEEVEHRQKFLLQGWRFPLCRPCDVPPMQPVTEAMKRQAAR